MEQSTDEPSVSHPLIADAYKYPEDFSSATYRIDPRAKWHDGKPVTADDVVWSFNVLKANSPMYNRYYANVTEAVAISDREVEFRFDQKGNRELPKIIGDLVVLPKHWWEGTDASGKKRDITKTTLEPPLGSGPYKVERFKPGAEIVWTRVKDYWAAKLPVKIGRENFDTRRYVYFQDDNAAWQAFTKGGYRGHPPRKPLAALGDRLQFSGVPGRRRQEGRIRDDVRRADAGLRPQHAPAAIPGPPRARGADLRLRFREHEPHALLWLLHAHGQLFRGRRAGLQRSADRQGAGDPQPVQGQAAARAVHQGVQAAGLRYAAGDARESAPRLRSLQGSGLGQQGRQARQGRHRRAVQDRVPRRRPDRRAHRRAVHHQSAGSSASTPRCASSTAANMSTATTISTSTS